MADDQNIFDLTTQCDEAFERIAANPDTVCAPVVEQLQRRFDEWAKHLGARAPASLSLDTRLMYSKTLGELVSNYLQAAKGCLDNVVEESEKGAGPPSLDTIIHMMSPEERTKAAPLLIDSLLALESAVDGLYHLGIAIRQSSSGALSQRVQAFIDKNDDSLFETVVLGKIKQHLIEGVQAAKTSTGQARDPDVDEVRGASQSMCTQLAVSVTFRHFTVLYRRSHEEKLAMKRANKVKILDADKHGDIAPGPRQESLLQGQEKHTLSSRHPRNTMPIVARPRPEEITAARSESAPTMPDSRAAQRKLAPSLRSFVSGISVMPDNVDFPRPPVVPEREKHARCPYCCKFFGRAEYDNEKWWSSHIRDDLQLYACISEQCLEPPQLFARFEEWKRHMDEQHTKDWIQQVHLPVRWCCELCPEETWFDDETNIERHILVEHKEYADESQLTTLKEWCEVHLPRPPWTCPVCNCIPSLLQPIANSHRSLQEDDVSRDKLLHHVATHLKNLGFLSITLLPGDDEDDKTQASGASRGEKANTDSLPPVVGSNREWIPEDSKLEWYPDPSYMSHDDDPPFLRDPPPLQVEEDWKRVDVTAVSQSQDQVMKDSLELARGLKGPEHPDIVAGLTKLANWQEQQGEIEAAIATYSQAVELIESISDGAHEQTMFLIESLRDLHRQQARIYGGERMATLLRLEEQAQVSFDTKYRREHSESEKTANLFDKRPPSLAELIHQTFVESECDQRQSMFSPEGSLDHLITRESILGSFCRNGQMAPRFISKSSEKIVEFILGPGKKLFAICILSGFKNKRLRQVMCFFKINYIDDTILPLESSSLKTLSLHSTGSGEDDVDDDDENGNEPLWNDFMIDNFFHNQWRLCAPIFSADKMDHNLPPFAILPFIEEHRASRAADTGWASRVIKYKIHKRHLDADDLNIPNTEYVAVKHTGLGNAKYATTKWYEEVKALWGLRALNQPHILKFITAYRRGKQDHCLILEWANGGNLRNLWKDFPRPTLTGRLVRDACEQLHGLAQALDMAHYPKVAGGSPFKSFRHGDLKPENILWFKDENGDGGKMGTLKIGDWGQAKRIPNDIATKLWTGETSAEYGSRRYEPPEEFTFRGEHLKPAKRQSRYYDVWSMGCIALELLIWLMYGPDELNIFNQDMRGRQFEWGPFYEVDPKGAAKVHRVAVQWMQHMAKDPVCNVGHTALGDLLGIIKDQLLVVALPMRPEDKMSTFKSANDMDRIPSFPGKSSTTTLDPQIGLSTTPNVPEVLVAEPVDSASKLPRLAEGGRANAKDFSDRMQSIVSDDDKGESYWLTGVPLPPPEIHADELLLRPQDDNPHQTENPERRADTIRLEKTTSEHSLAAQNKHGPPTKSWPDKSWKYIIDNDFATRVASSIKNQFPSAPPVSQSSKLCSTCQTLRDSLWAPNFGITYDSGFTNADTCHLCEVFSIACKKRGAAKGDHIRFFRDRSVLFLNRYESPMASICRSADLRTGIDPQIQVGLPVLPSAGSEPHLDIIRHWLRTCDSDHSKCSQGSGGNRSGSLGRTKKMPTRVIAVGRKGDGKVRLYEPFSGEKGEWIALSLRLGELPSLRTTTANLSRHMCVGIDMRGFPAIYRDAVIVTRALGLSYLWIGSLCIVQDDNGDCVQEVKRMEQVYSRAYCVLATSRIPSQHTGFLNERRNRSSVSLQRQGDSAPFYISEFFDDFEKHALKGPLTPGAWVLEQRAFARRTVYFTDHQTYFECGEGVRCETMTKMTSQSAAFLGDPNFPQMMVTASKGKGILAYQDLYKTYCGLRFLQPTDRPLGIDVLQKRILAALGIKGGFGVFFDDQENGGRRGHLRRSLLWYRAEDNETLERIDFSSPSGKTKIPSWSWMAYMGYIDYLSPPFGGVDWSPFQTQWDSGPTRSDDGVLIAEARDYILDDEKAAQIVIDCPSVSERLESKCVIVGREKKKTSDGDTMHYVLLVHPIAASDHDGSDMYERLGAGKLPGKCIKSSGVKIRIH